MLEYLEGNSDYEVRLNRVWLYAYLRTEVNAHDEEAQQLLARVRDLMNRASAATAWEQTELLELDEKRWAEFIHAEPRLERWARHLQEIWRRRPHLKSSEVEAMLRQLDDVMVSASAHQPTLQRELRFEPIEGEHGQRLEVNLATMPQLSRSPNRVIRERVDAAHTNAYRAHQDSFAAFLHTEVKRRVFTARVRGHASSLEAAMFEADIPVQVFETTLETFRAHLPVWHRYWEVRRKALGLERLRPFDFSQRLSQTQPVVSYDEAARWVSQAMRPLGEAYASVLERGLTTERWVDMYPSEGKRFREYSIGVDGSKPFILMWFYDNLTGLDTLAHESGHSMHSYHTYQSQPHQYAGYGVAAAETAANLHQALLHAHLLQTSTDPHFRLAVLEKELDIFVRYLFRMPIRARFEAELHAAVERGEALTAERLTKRFTELNAEAYGPAVAFGLDDGLAWTEAGVLYQHFASFQYILGIAGGQAIAQRLLSGQPGVAQHYLEFLRAGKSIGQLEALRLAGVDFATPEPLERAFQMLEERVDQLEQAADSLLATA